MTHSPHRRWSGCPMCKPHKFADQGRAFREPAGVLREIGATKRVRRGDLGEWEPRPRGHRRKDRRRWCRGKVGVEHTPATRHTTGVHRDVACGWNQWVRRWICEEERYCTTCGKILRRGLGTDCTQIPAGVGADQVW